MRHTAPFTAPPCSRARTSLQPHDAVGGEPLSIIVRLQMDPPHSSNPNWHDLTMVPDFRENQSSDQPRCDQGDN
jgi:hypothetical protein